MPKCNNCGNTRVFTHRTVEYEKCYYDESGYIEYSKSLEIESSVIVCCYECDSEDVAQ